MKFPISIILLLSVVISIVFFAMNTDLEFVKLDNSAYISPEQGSIKINTNLYFVYDDALRVESRRVTISDSNYSQAIIEAMQQGSENGYFESIFDFGVRINSIDIINDTCYVNFFDSQELNIMIRDSRFDLFIWSMVNSLTESNQIKNVQFLVQGKQYSRSMHGYNLNSPLPKLESLVYTKIKSPSDVVLEFIEYLNTQRYDLAYSMLTKNSMSNYDYSSFIKYANTFVDTHNEYISIGYYTRVFTDYEEVYIKFTQPYDSDGFLLSAYDKWSVYVEDDVYRINLIVN